MKYEIIKKLKDLVDALVRLRDGAIFELEGILGRIDFSKSKDNSEMTCEFIQRFCSRHRIRKEEYTVVFVNENGYWMQYDRQNQKGIEITRSLLLIMSKSITLHILMKGPKTPHYNEAVSGTDRHTVFHHYIAS